MAQEASSHILARGEEKERIARLISNAYAGTSTMLLLRGEPGVGKTTLLDHAVAEATARGMTVVRTTGFEIDAEIAFTALLDIARPLLHLMSIMPQKQAEILRSALALEDMSSGPAPAERVAVGLATLGLLAEASMANPLLIAVDDAQWIDEASAAVLAFVARRLQAERVAMMVALRETGTLFANVGLPELEVRGLDRAAAATLLNELTDEPISSDVIARSYAETAGNPLALTHVARQLRMSGLTFFHSDGEPLPTSPRLLVAYGQRLADLPPDVRRAATIAAAMYTDDTTILESALRHAGLDESTLDLAENANILQLGGGTCNFAHPLLRSAAYHSATPTERRQAHKALATALAERPSPVDRDQRAWHLAAAATSTNANAAEALAEVGARARRRGALSAAGRAYERASVLSPHPGHRIRYLLEAVESAHLAGRGAEALTLLDRLTTMTDDPGWQAAAEALRGQVDLVRLPPRSVHDRLVRTARGLQRRNPAQATRLFIAAATAASMGGAVEQAVHTAERAVKVADRCDAVTGQVARVLQAHTMLLTGQSQPAAGLLDGSLPILAGLDPLAFGVEVTSFAAMDLMWLERHRAARSLLRRAVAHARSAAAIEPLPSLLSVLADTQLRTSQWTEAYSLAEEAMLVAIEVKQPLVHAYALATIARIEAAQGKSHACREHAIQFRRAVDGHGADIVDLYIEPALALLDLGTGDVAAADSRLRALHARVEGLGVHAPTVLRYHADLLDASHPAHGRDLMGHGSTELEQLMGKPSTQWEFATVAYCRALVGRDDSADTDFDSAIQGYGAAEDPFSQARAQYAYGRHLRRIRRRAEASRLLNDALRQFEHLRARPWADRVQAELQAAGHGQPAARRKQDAGLTGQERQVAMVVARGATNQEAASALFLSVKTIEYHLKHVYEKMHIRSRTELARYFRDQP